eukprot:CAMPEP_0167801468 /NCGR_PEP_ID=MMETSP0111_2-20121227/18448_1 /TAXON_ID=91324 /ORGANISM="Lotharella globosa, Strain CCCM811" /LENGTH=87 /DNA_ID=CAMNT_0007697131 /DNA_START=1 /DNA_END=261 /DNA_ORIENTATION=-
MRSVGIRRLYGPVTKCRGIPLSWNCLRQSIHVIRTTSGLRLSSAPVSSHKRGRYEVMRISTCRWLALEATSSTDSSTYWPKHYYDEE